MRAAFYFLLVFFTIQLNSQELQVIDGVVTMQEVAEIPEKTTPEIKDRVINWFGMRFRSGEDVVTSETESLVVGRYIRSYKGMNREFYHKISIEIKDERIRYTVSHLEGVDGMEDMEYWLVKKDGRWRTLREQSRLEVEQALRSDFNDLVKFLVGSEDDW